VEDSDSGVHVPDTEDSGVVQAVSGNGFEIEYDSPTWTVPSFSFQEHLVRQPEHFPDWVSEVDRHMFGIERKHPVERERFKSLIADDHDASGNRPRTLFGRGSIAGMI
jgi:hypothetical protein